MQNWNLFPNKDLIELYRRTFSSPAGKVVLKDILADLGVFFPVTDGEKDIALKNYGIRLMSILGGGTIEGDAIDAATKLLMRQEIRKPKE